MNVKIRDLMAERVITAQPHHSVDHVRGLMERNAIHAVPVVGPDDTPVGIISTADLIGNLNGNSPVRTVMTERVYTVPAYNDAHIAARMMRNHKIHHVVVTHEKQVVGIVSSFDLLRLVEDHRFVMKPSPQSEKQRAG